MSMYAIKDTTLTALGDAVRSKTSEYITVDEMPTSIFDISFDTREMAEYEIRSGQRYYTIPLNLIEMFGDERTKITKLYVSGNYECYVGGTFTYWPGELSICFNSNRRHQIAGGSDYQLKGEINSTIEIPAYYWDGSENTFIELNGNDWVFTDKPLYDGWYKANIKIWAMNSEDNYFTYNSFTPLEMVDKINGLETIPDKALNLTGNCNDRFANGAYDWLINQCGEKMTTKNIDSMESMFAASNIETIPFEINGYSGRVNVMNCFSGSKVKQLPKMNIPQIGALNSLFNNAYYLREIPDDKWNVGVYSGHTGAYDSHTNIFSSCYSLRYITPKLLSNIWNKADGYYYSCYYSAFGSCHVLDELIGLPVALGNYTSNAFTSTFNLCYRLKNITFAVNEDGTPKTAEWKSQTIDVSNYVGYVYPNNRTNILNWNSGITANKEVMDDATYQALKDDPDWYSVDINYSRYNHTSAVNTINSLPDCSASGGTNIIKFKGASGALTDGGAINTLTEEEIAVAAAKGWTVSLV